MWLERREARGVGLVMLALVGCASRPRSGAAAEPAEESFVSACGVEKRVRAICSQLERMELRSPQRGAIDFRVENCRSLDRTVFVSWPSAVPGAPARSMGIEFRYPSGAEPFVPIGVEPVAMEWPCVEHCEQEELVAEVPVLDQCDAEARLERRAFTVPAVTATSCGGAALKNGVQKPDFCREKVARGATIYRIATRAAWSGEWREVKLELREGEALANVAIRKEDGRVDKGIVEAAAWEERLGAVWGMPTEVSESCYEEGLETVTALREGAWRIVVRRCTSVVELHDLTLTTSRMGAAP